jgi:hypothetical protein
MFRKEKKDKILFRTHELKKKIWGRIFIRGDERMIGN